MSDGDKNSTGSSYAFTIAAIIIAILALIALCRYILTYLCRSYNSTPNTALPRHGVWRRRRSHSNISLRRRSLRRRARLREQEQALYPQNSLRRVYRNTGYQFSACDRPSRPSRSSSVDLRTTLVLMPMRGSTGGRSCGRTYCSRCVIYQLNEQNQVAIVQHRSRRFREKPPEYHDLPPPSYEEALRVVPIESPTTSNDTQQIHSSLHDFSNDEDNRGVTNDAFQDNSEQLNRVVVTSL